jgi:hypothetical protein
MLCARGIKRLAVCLLCAATLMTPPALAAEGPRSNSRKSFRSMKDRQGTQQKADAPQTPSAKPEDVASMDAILAALYDVISGPAGKKRDWNRMRSLFIPEGRLMAVGPRKEGGFGYRLMDVDGYVKASGAYLETNGFFEREVSRVVETYGQIAHVFSTYESRHKAEDAKPFMRGINSIQLMNDGKRWWIVSVYWEGEREDNPLPDKYLKPGGK